MTKEPEKRRSTAQKAASGMMWVSTALISAQFLSFFSQVVLGSVLNVETYAYFGIAATALSMVAGFQSSGVASALIQSNTQFHDLFQKYTWFALQLGLLGGVTLIIIGYLLENAYAMPGVFGVILITSITVPLIPLNSVIESKLSFQYQFKELNIISLKKSTVYFATLVGSALLGAEIYTVAIATLTSVLLHHYLIRRKVSSYKFQGPTQPLYSFWEIFKGLRWVILAGFLFGLSSRADFIVLGRLMSTEMLGYYTFGVMLITSITTPFTVGINQVLLPIYSRLQHDPTQLKDSFIDISSAAILLSMTLSLVLLGMGSTLIHVVWEGKWDTSQVIVNVLSIAIPFRILSSLACTGLEAKGMWRTRNLVIVIEIIMLIMGAGLGAYWGGVSGAVTGVLAQRFLSGTSTYLILSKTLQMSSIEVLSLISKTLTPFIAGITTFYLLSSARQESGLDSQPIILAGAETCIALIIFAFFLFIFNRTTFLRLVEAASGKLWRS